MHRIAIAVVLGLFIFATTPAWAQSSVAPPEKDTLVRTVKEYNLPKKSTLAIKGYDPVAYFPEGGGKAVKGEKSIDYTYKGVTYRFASSEHRDLFKANPTRYEPAHGGWCSWAMRTGDKTGPDPKSFIVKDDRLFLYYKGFGGDTKKKWLETDHQTSADSADTSWKRISKEEKRQVKKKDEKRDTDRS